MESERTERARARGILGIVFVTIFLDLVGFGILIPIQPFYAEYFGARPATVTLLSASYSLVQFLCAPYLGRLSDRFGRRPVMLFTIGINAVGYALFGLAHSLAMLFFARITSGFGSANLGTAQAIIADSTTPETRAKGMGIIGAAFGLGFIFGPAIGGFFGQFGLATPAFVAACFSAGNWIFAYFFLPETVTKEAAPRPVPAAPAGHFRRSPGFGFIRLLRHANVPQLFWIYFFGTVSFSLMEQALGLFIERTWVHPVSIQASTPDQLRHAAAMTAWFLVAAGFTMTFVQGVLIGPLARRFGERMLLRSGTMVMTAALLLIPFVAGFHNFPLFLFLGPMLALGSGLSNPMLPSLLSQSAEAEIVGGTLGFGQSLSALGRVVGPSMAGILFEIRPGVPFVAGSLLMVTCVLVAFTIGKTALRPEPVVDSPPA